ncbi:MAG: xanthine dehydrogenase family protein molybdopterin-binding subunit [Spirochaetaceae bacterium]|jgi:CO/xanthine dehydrogenase Mo-binding subunit|nr:xanthine dehydrogenase family protein molybdopterin-binding subunit [Spirochaetaceae bacterium]
MSIFRGVQAAVDGAEEFVDDIELPGTLCGITIRSPVARGRLVSIDCPELPESCTLVRAKDIPGKNYLEDFKVPVLASSALSYIGEPVALLLGPDRLLVENLVSRCRVNVESENPRYGCRDFTEDQLAGSRDIRIGETDEAFKEAARVIEGVYRTGLQEHWYSEPSGALAEWLDGSARARIRVFTATQWPFQVKRAVAGTLGAAAGPVIVSPARIGVHLDGKIWYPALLACHAALGAYITKQPVRVMLTRREDFLYSPKRAPSEIRIRSAVGEKGRLLASEISVTADMGAYKVFADEILDQCCLGSLGIYKQQCIKINGRALSTNIPPAGPFAGFGLAQGFFAMERQAALIADTLKLNPIEWRKENILSRKKNPAIGVPFDEDIFPEKLLDTAAAMGDYHRKWAAYETLRDYRRSHGGPEKNEPLRGVGIAAAYQANGFLHDPAGKGVYTVELTLHKDSSLEIASSMVLSNSDYVSIWKNAASEILALDPANIRVIGGGAGTAPDSGPACLSRGITAVTQLVALAAGAIRKQRFRDPLPIKVRRSCKCSYVPQWGAETGRADRNAFSHAGWGAVVVEVEIDPVEYTPNIRGVWMSLDGGKILSQRRAWRATRFSIIQALGWASGERLSYEDGVIPDGQFLAYELPGLREIPPIHIDFIFNETALPKGIGDIPFNCVPAAFAQAVSQAVDYPFERIPVTARDIWDTGKFRRPRGAGP